MGWVGFNYLIGNEDAHSKNLALLYRSDGLRLTPHYDLISTEVYPELQRGLAMKIGRATDIRNVQRDDWQRFAEIVALPWDRVRTALLELKDLVARKSAETIARHIRLYGNSQVYESIRTVIQRRGEQLARELRRSRGR